jgi:hypothetical protein
MYMMSGSGTSKYALMAPNKVYTCTCMYISVYMYAYVNIYVCINMYICVYV